jgi:hypothetical protein
MLFDFGNKALGQVLVDFGKNPLSHIGGEGMPQLRERARGSRNDERLHAARPHNFLQGSGN